MISKTSSHEKTSKEIVDSSMKSYKYKTVGNYTINLSQKVGEGKYGEVFQAYTMSSDGKTD